MEPEKASQNTLGHEKSRSEEYGITQANVWTGVGIFMLLLSTNYSFQTQMVASCLPHGDRLQTPAQR